MSNGSADYHWNICKLSPGKGCPHWNQQDVGIRKIQKRRETLASLARHSPRRKQLVRGDPFSLWRVDTSNVRAPQNHLLHKCGRQASLQANHCSIATRKEASTHPEWVRIKRCSPALHQADGTPLRMPWRESCTSTQGKCEELFLLIVRLVAPNCSVQTVQFEKCGSKGTSGKLSI